MKKVFVCGLICLFFSGCGSNHLGIVSGASDLPVKFIDEDVAKDCKFVGVANGHANNPFKSVNGNKFDARLMAAKEAFSLGGNAVVINYTYVEYPSNYVAVNMDVCNCSE